MMLFFLVCLQLSNLDSVFADVESPLDQSADELISDRPVITHPMGTDLELSKGTGYINLTLLSGTLEFKVCPSKCMGKSQICYDSKRGFHISEAVGSCQLPPLSLLHHCGFEIKGDEANLNYPRNSVSKNSFSDCLTFSIGYEFATIDPEGTKFESCIPNIDSDNDNIIKLWVDIISSCPIIVKNAVLYIPPSTSTFLPSSSVTVPSSKKEESSNASLPWWAIMIISIVGFLALVTVGIVVFCICKKRQRSKQVTPPTAPTDPKPVPTVPAAANVTTVVETSSKRRGNLNFSKFQPRKTKEGQEKEEGNNGRTTTIHNRRCSTTTTTKYYESTSTPSC